MLILKLLIAAKCTDWESRLESSKLPAALLSLSPAPAFLPSTEWRKREGRISSFGETRKTTAARRHYPLTKAGRRQLEAETKRWGRRSWAIAQALEAS